MRQMPPSLTFNDFEVMSLTCELRYASAFLIFDRTGQIIRDVQRVVPNVRMAVATPPQTTFTIDGGTFVIELGACRFSSSQEKRKFEVFADYCQTFFDAVTGHLEIEIFERVGLRHVMKKHFKSETEARAVLSAMQLANLKPAKRFNISDSPSEVLCRWEDSQIGTTVRLKAETVELIQQAEQAETPTKEVKTPRLILDVDYYTVAPVEREQWKAQEWLAEKVRMIRKEIDFLL
jgi:uncharacterized protein (TIGR04255 family)